MKLVNMLAWIFILSGSDMRDLRIVLTILQQTHTMGAVKGKIDGSIITSFILSYSYKIASLVPC